jgi:N-glycosylase/DNA lyase
MEKGEKWGIFGGNFRGRKSLDIWRIFRNFVTLNPRFLPREISPKKAC